MKVSVLSEDLAAQINAILSQRLAQERMRLGVSKKKLAMESGMTRSTVAFIEDPAENPTIYNLLRYALALGIDLGSVISSCQKQVQDDEAAKEED